MKTTLKTFFSLMAAALLLTSCLGDNETYRAGFSIEKPTRVNNYYYANNTSDSLVFWSYGNWSMTDYQGYDNSWFTMPRREGKGLTVYSELMTFTQNTTGEARLACFLLQDNTHPGDAHSGLSFYQYATRGDGSMGMAADVKSITGSDGSSFAFTYDTFHRPLTLLMKKGSTTLKDLAFTYDDHSNTMTVDSRGVKLTGSYGKSYLPESLVGMGDTVTMSEQTYFNMMTSAFAFNFIEGFSSGAYQAYGYLLQTPPSHLDSIYVVDSLRYQSYDGKGGSIVREYMSFKYSTMDNRYQSIDVNQLLLGVEQCNPYLLLSLCRMARSSLIVSEATFTDAADNISVVAQLNADKSVQKLIVTRRGNSITYDFEY
jgi:hypothetical protein